MVAGVFDWSWFALQSLRMNCWADLFDFPITHCCRIHWEDEREDGWEDSSLIRMSSPLLFTAAENSELSISLARYLSTAFTFSGMSLLESSSSSSSDDSDKLNF